MMNHENFFELVIENYATSTFSNSYDIILGKTWVQPIS